ELFSSIENNNKTTVSVCLEAQTVTNDATGTAEHFEINAYKKECFLNGYDDSDYLLANRNKIEEFENDKNTRYNIA
ncbi:MAG: 3-isopropylmalate dehydratase small subunit, partial [Paludibacteraceae bacterium]|nr:3-isopropylmalate dehydratase small subunit [Paludibacteraceae bacterium]